MEKSALISEFEREVDHPEVLRDVTALVQKLDVSF